MDDAVDDICLPLSSNEGKLYLWNHVTVQEDVHDYVFMKERPQPGRK